MCARQRGAPPCPPGDAAQLLQFRAGAAPIFYRVILDHVTVHEADDARRVLGDIHLVRHHHHGFAFAVQFLEDVHDLDRGARVQITGRFVAEENRRVVNQRAGDSDALLLPAGKLIGLVVHSIR